MTVNYQEKSLNIEVITVDELTKLVDSLKTDVPYRGPERKTEHCEKWLLNQVLSSLLSNKLLRLPFRLAKRERPDFIVEMDNILYGIEATEIIHPDFARLQTLPEAKGDNSLLDSSLFKWGQPSRSTSELKEIAKREELTGSPWMGDSVEEEFAQSVLDTVMSKHRKLISGYSRPGVDCLMAYHNQSTPGLNYDKAFKLAQIALEKYWGAGFDIILVLKDRYLFVLTPKKSFVLINAS